MTDEHLLYYASYPQAHRASAVDPNRRDDTLDALAANVWAQRDHDERQLESLRSRRPATPCAGWTFEDRVLARGAVDAVLAGLRRLDPETVQRLLSREPEEA